MAGREVSDLSRGECGWKALDKLIRERSLAIQNLSTRTQNSLRLPPIESPVPLLMVNSEEVGSEGQFSDGSTENIADTDRMWAPKDAALRNDSETVCVQHVSVIPGFEAESTQNRFLSVPPVTKDSPLLRRRRSVGACDLGSQNDPERNRSSNGSSKSKEQFVSVLRGPYRGRSMSPSLRSTLSAPTILSATLSRPRSPHTPCGISPTSSPDNSPGLSRRRSSLSISAPSGGGKGPPTNTENRLRTRSNHYKLQKFLDESKSQFTTAQTLEMYNSTPAMSEKNS